MKKKMHNSNTEKLDEYIKIKEMEMCNESIQQLKDRTIYL